MDSINSEMSIEERRKLATIDVENTRATVNRLVENMMEAIEEDADSLSRLVGLSLALKLMAGSEGATTLVATIAIEELALARLSHAGR